MTKKFKKILVGLVASAMCVTGSMGAISASAASTYTYGDPAYGSCWYYLTNSPDHSGSVTSFSSITRYCTVKIYIASSVTATPLPGTEESGASNLTYDTTLNVSKSQTASSPYKYCYRADLYGDSQGPYVPVVETKYLNLSA